MKKLLKIALLVTVFACIFALCASASTIYKDKNGNEIFRYETTSVTITPSEGGNATFDVISSYTGQFPKFDENGVHLTWYYTAKTTSGDDTVFTVEALPTLPTEGYEKSAGKVDASNGKFSYISPVTQKNVVSANFPDNSGILTFAFNSFGGYNSRSSNNILFCYMPNTMKSLDESLFQETPIIVAELDDEMPITIFPAKFAHGARNLREVHIPASVETIKSKGSYQQGTTFYQAYCLERVTFSEKSKLKTIESYVFANSGLTYITLPDCLESLGTKAFLDTKIINSPFTENSKCTTWGSHVFRNCLYLENIIIPGTLSTIGSHGRDNEGEFALCTSIELVTFGKGASDSTLFAGFLSNAHVEEIVFPEGITHIPDRYFHYVTGLTEVVFPNSVKTAGGRVFESSSVEKVVLGAGFTHFVSNSEGNQRFFYLTNNLKEVYIPASFFENALTTKQQLGYVFQTNSSNVMFFYMGKSAQDVTDMIANFKASTTTNEGDYIFYEAKVVSYEDYLLDTEKYATGRYIIYGYNTCEAFYNGVHMDDGNSCVVNCDQCGIYGVMEENPQHSFETAIAYENGYASVGVITRACSNVGCVCNASPETQDAAPIFDGYYYSTRINTSYVGLVLSYNVDIEALDLYNEISGQSLEYGVLAVAKDGLSGNPAVGGEAQDGVISTELSASRSPRIDFIIKGSAEQWNTPLEQGSDLTVKDLEFYILGFVNDGTLKYFYDTDFNADIDQIKAVTFNEIKALAQA